VLEDPDLLLEEELSSFSSEGSGNASYSSVGIVWDFYLFDRSSLILILCYTKSSSVLELRTSPMFRDFVLSCAVCKCPLPGGPAGI